jgi:hypothetical protein
MLDHGEGPKIVYVTAYARWQNGKRLTVESHHRGMTPPMSLLASLLQLDFGF